MLTKTKKQLSLIIVLLFIFTLFRTYDFTVRADPLFSGSGTSSDPYLISSAEELNQIRNSQSTSNTYFKQTKDIDLSSIDNWAAISPFQGHYDGNGYKISNLKMSYTSNQQNFYQLGLFGSVTNSELKNIQLKDVNISSNNGYIGALAGQVQNTNITDCNSTGSINVSADYSSNYNYGGFFVGGLVGFVFGINSQNTYVQNSSSTCSITSNYSFNNNDMDYGYSILLGGLIGYNYNGKVKNTYATGNMTVTINNQNNQNYYYENYVGGLIGYNYGTVENSYAANHFSLTGVANNVNYIGGLIGINQAQTNITSSYYDKDLSGLSVITKGTPKSTAEMKSISTFSGWDSGIWILNDGQYPLLKPVDNPPTDISLSNNKINENSPKGTEVASISSADADANDTATYSLVSGEGSEDNSYFSIDGSKLVINTPLNFEAKENYNIRIRVTDSFDKSFEKEFTITALNVNEAPTDLILSNNEIQENSAQGTAIGTLSASDPDLNDEFTYSIPADTNYSDNSKFIVEGNILKSGESFNYEVKHQYNIKVRVTDKGGLYFEKAFTINITDVDEAPTDIGINNLNFHEGITTGSVVGSLIMIDEDADETPSFSLVSGLGDDDNSKFTISENHLIAAGSFNYEQKNSFKIRLRAVDKAGKAIEKAIVLDLADVNEAPTDINLSSNNIPENSPVGTVIGTLSDSDEDANDLGTYTLVKDSIGTDSDKFSIDGNKLKTALVFDYEVQKQYNIKVKVTDKGGLTYEKVFTISITNVNEPPKNLLLNNNNIAENNSIGAAVGTFSCIFSDENDSASYKLVPGDGDSGNSSFTIDGNTLKAVQAFDYEYKTSYSIRVQAIDKNGLTFEKNFTIDITDVNDGTVRIIPVVVDSGNQGTTATVQVPVVRTVDSNGVKIDTVKINEDQISETINNGLLLNTDVAVIYVEDLPNDPANLVNLQLSKESMNRLANSSMNLKVDSDKAKLEIPKETLNALGNQDINIAISPITDSATLSSTNSVRNSLSPNAKAISTPLHITTNFSMRTRIVLRLDASTLPTADKLNTFLSNIYVLIQHSDGENEVVKGDIVYDSNSKPTGVAVWVNKFSIFTILNNEEPAKLVQTGYFVDQNLLELSGILMLAAGAAFIFVRRKRE